jgi:hypothetical protein
MNVYAAILVEEVQGDSANEYDSVCQGDKNSPTYLIMS